MSVTVHIDNTDQLRALIDLADHPRDVATTTAFTGLAVVVPDYVWARYQKYLSLDSAPTVPVEEQS